MRWPGGGVGAEPPRRRLRHGRPRPPSRATSSLVPPVHRRRSCPSASISKPRPSAAVSPSAASCQSPHRAAWALTGAISGRAPQAAVSRGDARGVSLSHSSYWAPPPSTATSGRGVGRAIARCRCPAGVRPAGRCPAREPGDGPGGVLEAVDVMDGYVGRCVDPARQVPLPGGAGTGPPARGRSPPRSREPPCEHPVRTSSSAAISAAVTRHRPRRRPCHRAASSSPSGADHQGRGSTAGGAYRDLRADGADAPSSGGCPGRVRARRPQSGQRLGEGVLGLSAVQPPGGPDVRLLPGNGGRAGRAAAALLDAAAEAALLTSPSATSRTGRAGSRR